MSDAEKWARWFHETYESLAPDFGYETRTDTREFDPTTPNGQLMMAVCANVVTGAIIEARDAEIERLRAHIKRGREMANLIRRSPDSVTHVWGELLDILEGDVALRGEKQP
jgi:hypothetical protein